MSSRWPLWVDLALGVAAVAVVALLAWRIGEVIDNQRASQECIIRLMLVEPEDREGFRVESILDSCPDALPGMNADDLAGPR